MDGQILIAGIGNIFLGDDAFGVEVAQRLAKRDLPENVRVVDYGIRGIDLAYALLDQPDMTILIDATMRGDAPGTLYLIEPDQSAIGDVDQPAIDPHGMNPIGVLQMVRRFGGQAGHLVVVSCEPAVLEPEDGRIGLSAPVQSAVEEAIDLVMSLVEQACDEHRSGKEAR
jgi:hydrogenase maturation protease